MTELDSSVKTMMNILGKLDEFLEEESEADSGVHSPSIYDQIYQRILSDGVEQSVDLSGRLLRSGNGIAILPGTDDVSCQETLLVFMFPVFNRLGERYPNNVQELRLNAARKYIEVCPVTKNVIFYGPVWDSTLWKMHKNTFAKCESFLKLFFTVYTKLKK